MVELISLRYSSRSLNSLAFEKQEQVIYLPLVFLASIITVSTVVMEIGHLNRRKARRAEKRSLAGYYKRERKNEKTAALLREYVQTSTIHGIQHIFREGETLCHSLTWAVLWILCVSGAVYVAFYSWKSNVNNPIAITITNTQYPLERVWFPAVVLCPSNKIILQKANEYISLHVRNKTVMNDSSLVDFYKSLALLQHPLYVQMDNFLENCKYLLPQLANINITALMYYSFPKCEDLLTFCYWQGNIASCCQDLFSLQRSEEGFCYSFNSLTSEGINSTCMYFDAHNDIYKGCNLAKLITFGPSTGLQVYFKILDTKKYPSLDFTGGPKLKVQVFHPNDFPQPGIFNLVPINGYNKLAVEIEPTVTKSTESIKRLNVEDRGCIFKEEVGQSKITRSFSQASCFLECRMAYFLRKCYCLPYYFNRLQNESSPVCSSQQLPCIVNVSSDLKYDRPRIGFTSFLRSDSLQTLSCSHCSPTCNEVTYEVYMDSTMDLHYSNGRQKAFDGFIDIYYRTPGAVQYTRDVTYDFIKILANIGGIGGLFLGGSILSITEIIYWFTKAGLALVWPNNKLEQKTNSSKQPFNKHQIGAILAPKPR